MPKFLPLSGFKRIVSEDLDFNKYTSNSSKECVLEVDLEYPNELWEFGNDYPKSLNKKEIRREMLSDYQLKIADL